MKQWVLGITKYADRLLADLDLLDWPEPIKSQQRNWIGRSLGAEIRFRTSAGTVDVFTTRPDTVFGATYLVLAPEHPMVDALTAPTWPDDLPTTWTGGSATPIEAIAAYREATARRSDRDRLAMSKSGVFTGSYATSPVTDASIPIFVADYVLMGYGTGAIMAVPAHDQRDFEFARAYDLPIPVVVAPPTDDVAADIDPLRSDSWSEAFVGRGTAVNSANHDVSLDGRDVEAAKTAIVAWLETTGAGAGSTEYKLRDWLFSRQRYWGEPFPIVFGADGEPRALPDSELPLLLPPMADFSPETSDDAASEPRPPLARAEDWTKIELDLGDGPQPYQRDTNTMPNWAGSCWYELRYVDPLNSDAMVDPENERYWMGPLNPSDCGGADLYVGGVEHAVLHLLYARFWHKVLFDLGKLSSNEPFRRLFNQGMIQAYVYRDSRGFPVEAAEVTEVDGTYLFKGEEVSRELGKIGKSLKNAVSPDSIFEQFGADTLRLYEMFGGPLDQSRPWDSTAVVGMHRLLQRVWRLFIDEQTGGLLTSDTTPATDTLRKMHRTIAAVRQGMETLRFNTSIARITELCNHLTAIYPSVGMPREVGEVLTLLLAPLAPHIAEELWMRQGHDSSLAQEPFPLADDALTHEASVEIPVTVGGKVRGRITVPAAATAEQLEQAALAEPNVASFLALATVRRVVTVPGKMVNFVLDSRNAL